MKKGIMEYLADVKKALTPKMLIFIAVGVVAFVIHPLLGLIFVGLNVMSSEQAFGNPLVENMFQGIFC